jgi:hypothetical protein
MGKVLAGVFVGVFVGALTYELLRKTGIGKTTARKVSEGFQAAKKAFEEGYQAADQTAQEPLSTV